MGFGFFKNVVDTDYFDFDLSFDAETLGAPCYSGGFEMNFDLRDELKLAGIYLQGSHSVFGSEDDSSNRIDESSLTAGKWLSVSEKAQVLLQYDSSYNFDEREYSRGSAALGFNCMVSGETELVSEFALDVPDDGEDLAGSVSLGFVFSL